MSEVKQIDIDNFSKRSTSEKFPYFFLKEVNNTTPLVVPLLEQGDIPVVCVYNGGKRVLSRVSNSAYNVDKLLRTHGVLEYVKSEMSTCSVKCITDYLEVL